ncbi:MAG: preprotein translocase subunit SecE [bacterium]
MFEKIKTFMKEVKIELKKVTWPSRYELRGSTGVVILTVLLFTLVIWLVDQGFARLVGLIIK